MNTTALLVGVGIGAAATLWWIHHKNSRHDGPGLAPDEIAARRKRVAAQAQRLANLRNGLAA